jgi:hypothetical protein
VTGPELAHSQRESSLVKEITMTFANIQDIRVTANPLERLLGLAECRGPFGGRRR